MFLVVLSVIQILVISKFNFIIKYSKLFNIDFYFILQKRKWQIEEGTWGIKKRNEIGKFVLNTLLFFIKSSLY